jgi:hypothetical protein
VLWRDGKASALLVLLTNMLFRRALALLVLLMNMLFRRALARLVLLRDPPGTSS